MIDLDGRDLFCLATCTSHLPAAKACSYNIENALRRISLKKSRWALPSLRRSIQSRSRKIAFLLPSSCDDILFYTISDTSSARWSSNMLGHRWTELYPDERHQFYLFVCRLPWSILTLMFLWLSLQLSALTPHRGSALPLMVSAIVT